MKTYKDKIKSYRNLLCTKLYFGEVRDTFRTSLKLPVEKRWQSKIGIFLSVGINLIVYNTVP